MQGCEGSCERLFARGNHIFLIPLFNFKNAIGTCEHHPYSCCVLRVAFQRMQEISSLCMYCLLNVVRNWQHVQGSMCRLSESGLASAVDQIVCSVRTNMHIF